MNAKKYNEKARQTHIKTLKDKGINPTAKKETSKNKFVALEEIKNSITREKLRKLYNSPNFPSNYGELILNGWVDKINHILKGDSKIINNKTLKVVSNFREYQKGDTLILDDEEQPIELRRTIS